MTIGSAPAAELLLLGYGQLNTALVHLLQSEPLRLGNQADQLQICAVSRTPRDVAASPRESVHLRHVAMDLLEPDFNRLPQSPVAIIYCLTPSTSSPEGYRRAYVEPLEAILEHYEAAAKRSEIDRPAPHVFFISSTGVYAQADDETVTETSATEPSRFSGQIMLEAESRLRASALPETIIRFSGIYGPTRLGMLRGIVADCLSSSSTTEPSAIDESPFTNRIHDADCVRILRFLLQRLLDGDTLDTIYLASDPAPARRAIVAQALAAYIQSMPTHQRAQLVAYFGDSLEKGGLPEGSGRGGSKRCRPDRLLQAGYAFLYPDFMSGYSHIIDAIIRQPAGSSVQSD